ncbi:MAG: metallophosphoesterase [Neptuniibacter sp.]
MRVLGIVFLIALLFSSGCSTFRDSYRDQLKVKRQINPVKQDPVAYAPYKQRWVKLGDVVEIDASSSVSLQNKPLTYRWWLLEKPSGSTAKLQLYPDKVTLNIDVSGQYRVRLVANDGVFDSQPFDLLLSTRLSDLDRVRVVALGDAGTGEPSQGFVGEAIRQVCEKQGCDFVLGMGDNIYKSGPESIKDAQFDKKFEEPYQNLKLPFFMVLGNHDSSGLSPGDGGFNARGQIEVEYSKHSKLWAMPDRYYQIKAPLQGENIRFQPDQNPQPLVELFALDSTPVTSAPDFIPRYRINLYSNNMGNWLSAGLHNSRAQWKLAYAHHPYLSNGKHGNAGDYDSINTYVDKYRLAKYLPRLNRHVFQRAAGTYYRNFFDEHMCGELDMYLAGHDHNMQWLAPIETCGKTHFVVSGAGAKSNKIFSPENNPFYWQCSETIGFFWIDIVADTLTAKIYTVNPRGQGHQLAYAARFNQRNPSKVEVLHGERSCIN